MSPKVFIFAPSDPTADSHRTLERAGCELVLGSASWTTPKGNTEDEIFQMALGPGITWATESDIQALNGEVPDKVYKKEVIPRWRERCAGKGATAAQ
jgi:hypothetical protein